MDHPVVITHVYSSERHIQCVDRERKHKNKQKRITPYKPANDCALYTIITNTSQRRSITYGSNGTKDISKFNTNAPSCREPILLLTEIMSYR